MEYGCIGEHLPHSFSKTIHEKIEDYDYQLRELAPEDLDAFMRTADFRAVNVTIPYKQAVIPFLSEISEQARLIGAVNTVVNRDGKLYGYNTDFSGMDALLRRTGIDPSGKKVLILGTGGTSKTAEALMRYRGAREVYRVSRSGKEGALTYEEMLSAHTDTDILVNTTPAGMYPDTEGRPVDLTAFPSVSGVIDAVYNPLRTELVLQAESLRIPAAGGLFMLAAQAVYAAEYFTGKTYPKGLASGIFDSLVYEKRNLVLTGMSGVGKTFVGRALSEITGKEFVDIDAEIEAFSGTTIPEIFRTRGEAYFRELEAQAIREISKRNSLVISTGGGAVLRSDNIRELRKNGVIIFLKRDVETILPDTNRPLADTEEKIRKLYRERLPVYEKTAELTVPVTGTPRDTAERLLELLK